MIIDKLAFIDIKDKKILCTMSKGKGVWYVPGGKREAGETDYEALIREIKEELAVDIHPESIRFYGTFEAQAHGKPEGTKVRMTCYTAEFDGELVASAEIERFEYVNYSMREQSSPVDQLIFDDLKSKGLLE